MVMTHFIRFFCFLALFAFLFSSGQAAAQMQVNVRSGDHDGYSRLVFDWPESTTYKVSKSQDTLTITFDKAASIDSAKVNGDNLRNIGAVSSSSSGNLSVSIKIVPESDFRHFKIGKRVVVDVYDAKGAPSRKAAPAPEPVKEASVPAPSDPLKPAEGVEVQSLDGDKPHVISINSTTSVGMAAFEREGFLWLVFDKPELVVPPSVDGPDKDQFQKLEKIELQDGVAYRMPTPEGYRFYGEGGGLLWRVVITTTPRRTTPAKPKTEMAGFSPQAGGSLNWPLQGVRKFITVTDPLVGDDIQVVTVTDATQFAGDKRQYVELETLPSIVGLAFVPKADDIEVTSSAGSLVVTRPQGLALSPERDTAPVVLKDDIEKEQETFAEAEKPKRMTRIFDFARWEMGGVRSLEKNRRIIMAGLGDKSGYTKVEDLITLAKLNVANDRGQEALGLLRVAAQELPGIEENPEYIALDGAAAALAGKYDEAIERFSSQSLNDYGEISYWKAFTLAGLEDWRQADAIMPSTFDLPGQYPKQIKQPIYLSLAEVALRSAKTTLAQKLLTTLEEDFEDMSLVRQSKWKYLNGELERQLGQPELAMENWGTLLKGEDDYFRAKAGLSVTKMQLARQKITPEKAIDRLEGLRYAWRGDELETLINMRLGEVYIDNEEYLKGLSILRNAVSLSPNAKITEEVTDYMTETFRSLFTEGKLKDVSPLDAVSIYDEFKELTPIGKEGDSFVQELAERLVDVDLLGRASDLLAHQINHRLEGTDKIKVAIRLAAIRLLDSKPEGALGALDIAESSMKAAKGEGDFSTERREIDLLKARAFSKLDRVNEALAILKDYRRDPDVTRLKADIAWTASRWDEAADSFKVLIMDENISPTRPMTDYQTNLVLNNAIALNLSGNRVGLSSLRDRYGDLMMQSEKARLFDLVTRPRQLGLLGNRESVSSLISEVDMFGEFLDNYRKIN